MDLFRLSRSSIQAMQRSTTPIFLPQQRLHKSTVLQKLGCQKPCWDQARLSSLVNKQVGRTGRTSYNKAQPGTTGYNRLYPQIMLHIREMYVLVYTVQMWAKHPPKFLFLTVNFFSFFQETFP